MNFSFARAKFDTFELEQIPLHLRCWRQLRMRGARHVHAPINHPVQAYSETDMLCEVYFRFPDILGTEISYDRYSL